MWNLSYDEKLLCEEWYHFNFQVGDNSDFLEKDIQQRDRRKLDQGSTGHNLLLDQGSTGHNLLLNQGSTGHNLLLDKGSTGHNLLLDQGSTGHNLLRSLHYVSQFGKIGSKVVWLSYTIFTHNLILL